MRQQRGLTRVSILTLVYIQPTPICSWPTNVHCDAKQIWPKPDFEHVCAVWCCVWRPDCCKRGVRTCWSLKSQLCGGRCLCCLLDVPPVCFPCVLFSVVFPCGGGLVRLCGGPAFLNRQRFAHTCWQTSLLLSVDYVLIFLCDTPPLPAVHPGAPIQGCSEAH